MEERREWTNEDLNNYLQIFKEEEREAVLKVILESKLMQEFLSTTNGRLVLGGLINMLRESVMRITSLSLDGFDKNLDLIKQTALQINVVYSTMHNIANIATTGENHLENVKKRRGKR